MFSRRFYLSCPYCRTRARRTGRIIHDDPYPPFDVIEYECPGCWYACLHDTARNFYIRFCDEAIFDERVEYSPTTEEKQ